MKLPLVYGLAMAAGGALLNVVLYLAGFHESTDKLPAAQVIGTVVGLGIVIACLALAMKHKRASYPADAEWGYGPALGVGVLTSLVGALFGAVFSYVYFAFINPDMSEVILQAQVEKMEAAGISAAKIEQAQPMMKKWMSPGVMTVMQLFFGVIFGIVLSLIVAIFFRKREVVAPPTLA